MRTNPGDAVNPLVEHLRQVEAIEQDRWVAAGEACSKAEYNVSELRQRLAGAEQELVAAEHNRTVATERLSAVRDTISSAEQFLAQPGDAAATEPESEDPVRQEPPASSRSRPAQPADSAAPTLKVLVLQALADGDATPLALIIDRVRQSRPDTKANSVRSTLANMGPSDGVAAVGRGLYQLLQPEAHT
ncbi:hypothetical protein R2B67_21270 [Streptomyces cyaneofuscatus]|uniref:hypothetical protein n=1 Tax=Streptomyces cyaneofuscatus TaxID=66883 RepID=UPI0029530EC5|nr:hypothetical protein [Streptomyces cyaneofuscatus]WOP10903.1 hypothetical protein R2B67_21270 [Streptomyces cyaneofuscatus]